MGRTFRVVATLLLALTACESRGRLSPGGGRGGGGGGARPDATTPRDNKDAGGACVCDLTTACDMNCACDLECIAPMDAGNTTCACDIVPGVCDQGCACDPACGGTTDAGNVNCGGNPMGCVDHELRSPVDCSCLGVCENGWVWNTGTRMCDPIAGGQDASTPRDTGTAIDSGTPDSGVGAPDTGPMMQGDPFTPSALIGPFGSALCDYRARCQPALYSFDRTTRNDCIIEQTTRFGTIWAAYSQSIQAGRTAFRQSVFNTCLAQIGTSDCALGVPSACDTFLEGLRTVNQGCSLFDECGAGTYCDAAPATCGTCRQRTANGGNCGSTQCLENSVCATAGTQQICVPSNGLNAACGTIQSGLCSGQMQCVNGTCQRPAGNGATCDAMQTTAPDCDIFQNSRCINGTCGTLSWVGPGASCDPAGTTACDNRGLCDGGTLMCIARPNFGAACSDQMPCADGLYCNNGTCASLTGNGGSCTSGVACEAPYFCQGSPGMCSPLRWLICN